MDYMVSVIVPTYNHEKYIAQALDSILAQKISFSMEILIGDDCSTDNTIQILKKYKTQYPDLIKLFLQSENVGATRNAYNLLTNAQGKYLATLEGDDYWIDNNKLQDQVDFLEKHKEYIGCTHAFLIVDEFGKPLKNQSLSWVKQKKVFTLKDFDGILMPGQPSTFVRRNIFREPRYDYSLLYKLNPMVSDRTAMLIFLCQGDFYFLNNRMSCYRKSLDSSKSNITSKLYIKNNSTLLNDFVMLLAYENYAENIFQKSFHLDYRKEYFFTLSILRALRKKGDFSVTRKIFSQLETPYKAIIKLPINIWKIAIEHIRYKIC